MQKNKTEKDVLFLTCFSITVYPLNKHSLQLGVF